MFVLKIVAVLLLALISVVNCSGFIAPGPPALLPTVPAVPAVRYNLVAPQNIRPFAAQVSTFARGLSVYDAPYAAGVLNYPAIVNRAVFPAIPSIPAPVAPVAPPPVFAPGPFTPVATAPVVPSLPAVVPGHAIPAPVLPGPAAPVSALPAFTSAPVLPASVIPEPAPFIPAPVPEAYAPFPLARSVHAISPGLTPPLEPAWPAAPLLG